MSDSTPSTAAHGRVNEIDLLRFIASMAVLLFHFSFRGQAADGMASMGYPWLAPVFKYGYLGVQLFFLISGFVILMSAASGSVRRFAVSRVVRLYPAFWACCTLSYVACTLFGGPLYAASFSQYLVNMTMIADYLHVPPIDGVYWSLSLEIRFYVLVALLLLTRQIRRIDWFLAAWLAASAALQIHPIGKLRFLLISDFSAFFIGGAAFYLVRQQGLNLWRGMLILGSMVLGIFQSVQDLSSFQQHYHTDMNPWWTGGVVVMSYGVMLMVALRRTGPLADWRWATLGALTYPLYLLHQNIGYILFNHAYPGWNIHLVFWGTVALVLGLAWLVHRLIEENGAPILRRLLDGTIDTFSQLRPARS